ncbi:MAG: hypothetical protein ABI315_07700 [Bacteroidia bacterium]
MEVNYHSETIWTIENFLNKKECDDLILFSKQNSGNDSIQNSIESRN